MSFKNAFKCKNCPETNSEKGCPLWWEIMFTQDTTGEQKMEKNCGYILLPQLLIMTAKSANHTTYAAYDMRNKVVKNINKVIGAVKDKLELPDELKLEVVEDETPLLEEGEGIDG
jgi:hypothetical protein